MQCTLKQIFFLDLGTLTQYLTSDVIVLPYNPSFGPSPRAKVLFYSFIIMR